MKKLFFMLSAIAFALTAFDSIDAQTSSMSSTSARFTIQDALKVRRVSDPQISPDGKRIAFNIGDVNLEANRVVNQIYVVSIDGGEPKQLTTEKISSSSPRWSPNGERIAFGFGGQIYTMKADGTDKKQVTTISTEAGSPVWSPDGKMIAFVSDVYSECNGDDNCNKQKDALAESSKVKAHVTERLLFRHWTEWRTTKRTHVFVVDANGGTAREITNGDFDAPPYGASTGVDYAFSKDSKEITFLRNPDKVEAVSTNSDIYTLAVDSKTSNDAKNITVTNKGYDASPMYSQKDGRFIVYRSQATESFEADRWRLMVYDRQTGGAARELTTGFDLQVEDVAIAPDDSTVYFTANERGRQNIFSVPMNGGKVKPVAQVGYVTNLGITSDGKTLVFAKNSGTNPPEICKIGVDGKNFAQLTNVNTAMLKPFNMQKLEDFEWTGAENAKVHGLITKHANFDPNKKYPLFVLIHGGPQGANNDAWSYRWNQQIFANQGYIVFATFFIMYIAGFSIN
ncbi:MAG: S9 family peptidase, partial [Pyrinomonadaceae bacterium]|nr:S9 family peptidase [Pyrinomonadaceae bacterium]